MHLQLHAYTHAEEHQHTYTFTERSNASSRNQIWLLWWIKKTVYPSFLYMLVKIDTFNTTKCKSVTKAQAPSVTLTFTSKCNFVLAIGHISHVFFWLLQSNKIKLKIKMEIRFWLIKYRNWRWRIIVKQQSPLRTASYTLLHSGVCMCVFVCNAMCVRNCHGKACSMLLSAYNWTLRSISPRTQSYTDTRTPTKSLPRAHAPPNNKNKEVNMRTALTVLVKCDKAHCTVLIKYSALFCWKSTKDDKNKNIRNLAYYSKKFSSISKEYINSKNAKKIGNN